ncbi:MAG: glutathione S-transferase family protein [Telmatospirillum sp.]|nr:glutathione S-transferase family protein [Telmatospirillum sp.]
MITLFTFGPAFGLPDASPFVTKADLLLRMSGLPFVRRRGNLRRAPKGKLPYIEDDGRIVADSSFIRFHLEDRHGIDFDAGLSPAERGVAWSVEKMCEDHLYWLMVMDRWGDDGNFRRGPARFFQFLPLPVRPLVEWAIRRSLRRTLKGQGTARHPAPDRGRLALRDFEAIRDVIGDRCFLMGDQPCGADATVQAFLTGAMCGLFEGPVRDAAAAVPQLSEYCGRMTARFYPGDESPPPVPAAAGVRPGAGD